MVKYKKDNNNKIKNEVILKLIIQKKIDIPKNTDEEKNNKIYKSKAISSNIKKDINPS